MKNTVGLACVYQSLCDQIGWGFLFLMLGLVIGFVIYVVRQRINKK